MDKVTTFIWFEGDKALEAAQFYTSLLPDSRIDDVHKARTVTPSGPEGSVLFVTFTLAGRSYAAMNGARDGFNDAISLMVTCEDQAEVDRLWAALTANGGRPVACGWLKDRFGVSWQIVPRRLMELIADPDPAKGKRVMHAMMEMVKLDITALEKAAAAA